MRGGRITVESTRIYFHKGQFLYIYSILVSHESQDGQTTVPSAHQPYNRQENRNNTNITAKWIKTTFLYVDEMPETLTINKVLPYNLLKVLRMGSLPFTSRYNEDCAIRIFSVMNQSFFSRRKAYNCALRCSAGAELQPHTPTIFSRS